MKFFLFQLHISRQQPDSADLQSVATNICINNLFFKEGHFNFYSSTLYILFAFVCGHGIQFRANDYCISARSGKV